MICEDLGRFLNCNAGSFKDESGRMVDYYRVTFVPNSDMQPLAITCNKEVFNFAATLPPYAELLFGVSVTQSQRGVRCRLEYIVEPKQ